MWTYDICAFDTATYCDYQWQNHDDSNDVNKRQASVKLLAKIFFVTLSLKKVNNSLGIKSTAGLKNFIQ